MAILKNPWLDVFSRSYQSIKSQLVQNMRTKLPEVTDYSEGNIFIILLSMWSSVAEVIHYYLDNMARETFFISARRYSSLVKHSKLVDYHIKAAIPASTDVLIQINNGDVAKEDYIIPIGTTFNGTNGLTYISTKQKTFYKDTYGAYVPVEQKTLVPEKDLGVISNPNAIIYIDETDGFYVEGSAVLKLGGILWTLVETLGYSGPNDKHYMVELTEDQKPYIVFGDGMYGEKPAVNSPILLSYFITKGEAGNDAENTITSVDGDLGIKDMTITNPNRITGGSNYENFDMLKEHVPLNIRTLGVAITKQDYIDVTKLAPGVDKAYIDFRCGKFVDIYIIPDGGGVASESLRDATYRYVSSKKIITTNIRVLPAGSSYVVLNLTVTGMPSLRSNIISDDILRALVQNYDYSNSDINKVIRLSDLYALIDNLSTVDYLTIDSIYTIPYPNKSEDTETDLNLSNFKVNSIEDEVNYTISYLDKDTFTIASEFGEVYSTFLGSPITIISESAGVNFTFTIGNPLSGAYKIGDTWEMKVIPNGKDQIINDYSVPRIIASNVHINVIETS